MMHASRRRPASHDGSPEGSPGCEPGIDRGGQGAFLGRGAARGAPLESPTLGPVCRRAAQAPRYTLRRSPAGRPRPPPHRERQPETCRPRSGSGSGTDYDGGSHHAAFTAQVLLDNLPLQFRAVGSVLDHELHFSEARSADRSRSATLSATKGPLQVPSNLVQELDEPANPSHLARAARPRRYQRQDVALQLRPDDWQALKC